MNIVVTGAAGFVGSALLAALGGAHHIVAIDRIAGPALPDGRWLTGDIGDPALIADAFAEPCDALVHLATMPGGAAEADPESAWRINVEGSRALIAAAARHRNRPRILFASSIAVFGNSLPDVVDDATPVAPMLHYGAHKALLEEWIATLSRRGAIDGLSLRLPGIVARPQGVSGMTSAYMSDLFHAMVSNSPMTLPVSAEATSWLLSLRAAVACLRHALALPDMPSSRRLTLPALRVRMGDLVAEIGRQTGCPTDRIDYAPDPGVEEAFGRQPTLRTYAADALGFVHDGTLPHLVGNVFSTLDMERQAR